MENTTCSNEEKQPIPIPSYSSSYKVEQLPPDWIRFYEDKENQQFPWTDEEGFHRYFTELFEEESKFTIDELRDRAVRDNPETIRKYQRNRANYQKNRSLLLESSEEIPDLLPVLPYRKSSEYPLQNQFFCWDNMELYGPTPTPSPSPPRDFRSCDIDEERDLPLTKKKEEPGRGGHLFIPPGSAEYVDFYRAYDRYKDRVRREREVRRKQRIVRRRIMMVKSWKLTYKFFQLSKNLKKK